MWRVIILISLVVALSVISSAHHAMAFTVRFGAVPVSENPASMHAGLGNEVPTPQMFNLTVKADGLTLGPTLTAPKETTTVPTVRIRKSVQPRATGEPSTPIARRTTPPQQLRGAELMLLRQVKQLAKR